MASDSSAPASSLADALREAVDAGLPRAIAELSDLVRIPSVSWDGFDVEHVRRSAARVAELARETGVFDEVDVFDENVICNRPEDPDSENLAMANLPFQDPQLFETKMPGWKINSRNCWRAIVFEALARTCRPLSKS